MQRMVTKQDLIDYPELIQKGVSVNQHWEFPEPQIGKAFPHISYDITETKSEIPDYSALLQAIPDKPKKPSTKKKTN